MLSPAPRPLHPAPLSRIAWWGAWTFALAWLLLWLSPTLLGPHASPPCQPQAGVWRGADHVHARDHSGADHSIALVSASLAACLDFIILTEHEGLHSLLSHPHTPPTHHLSIWIGSERRTPQGHHHGVIGPLLTLNHPRDSHILLLSDLSPSEHLSLQDGSLGWEALNTGRFFKTPPSPRVWLHASLIGPSRPDLLLAAASLPGPDLSLWIDAQASLQRPILMRCGSDAHGDLLGYLPSLSSLVTYIPHPPSQTSPSPLSLSLGQSWCVNELLGPLRWRHLVSHSPSGCDLSISLPSPLPPNAHWLLSLNHLPLLTGTHSASLSLSLPGVYHLQARRSLSLGLIPLPDRLWALTQAWVITPDGRCLTLSSTAPPPSDTPP
jgi:hypothetical protein